jgi:hypothetical protein
MGGCCAAAAGEGAPAAAGTGAWACRRGVGPPDPIASTCGLFIIFLFHQTQSTYFFYSKFPLLFISFLFFSFLLALREKIFFLRAKRKEKNRKQHASGSGGRGWAG